MKGFMLRLIQIVIFFKVFCFSLQVPAQGYTNSEYAIVNGVFLHYRYWQAEAEKLKGHCLLVHGFGASTYSWEKVGDSLKKAGYNVVAIDVPPFGFSDKSPVLNQSVTARAMLLEEFLNQAFPGQRWHLAGHSMGGGIVLAMALMYPEDIISVNLVSAMLFQAISPGATQLPAYFQIPGLTDLLAVISENLFITRSRVEKLLGSAYGQHASDTQIEAYLAPLRIRGTARAIINYPYNYQEVAELNLKELQVPVLAIWGNADRWVPLESNRSLIGEIPGIRLRVIDNAGHIPMETHTGEFLSIWLGFLDSLAHAQGE